MKKLLLVLTVLFCGSMFAHAELDPVAMQYIKAIRLGTDNKYQIQTSRAKGDSSVGGNQTVGTNITAGGNITGSGQVKGATFDQTSVSGKKMLQYAKFGFSQTCMATIGTYNVSCVIPDNAIINGGFLWLDTVVCSTNNAMTLSIGVNAAANLLAAINTPTNGDWTANTGIDFIPQIETPTSYIKMTSAVSVVRFVSAIGSATGTVSGTGYISYLQGD